MSLWQRLRRWRTDLQQKKRYHSILGDLPNLTLTTSNTQENQNLDTPPDSLAVGLPYDSQVDVLDRWWILLSPREQDVTALTCLRYTNSQIAGRLGLSVETVRTYIEKVLNKLGLQSKADLRVFFATWDFSAWERRKTHR